MAGRKNFPNRKRLRREGALVRLLRQKAKHYEDKTPPMAMRFEEASLRKSLGLPVPTTLAAAEMPK